MLIESFLNLIAQKQEIEEGKKLKGSIINYSEHSESDAVSCIEAEVMERGEVYNVQMFINKDREYLSNGTCSCYQYSLCRHTLPVISRFIERNDIKNRTKKLKTVGYEYSILEKSLVVNYEIKLLEWIAGRAKYESSFALHLDKMNSSERQLFYYIVEKGNFELDEKILKFLDDIIEIGNRPEVQKVRYSLDMDKQNKLVVKEIGKNKSPGVIYVRNQHLLSENGEELTPEFLFERMVEYKFDDTIEISDKFSKYELETIKTHCILRFKEISRKMYLIPQMEIDGKLYSEFELLMLNTGYNKINSHKWARINIKEYKRFFNFLKSKNLEYKELGFLCKGNFWLVDYSIIPRTWEKIGIKDHNIKGEIAAELAEAGSNLKITYRINRFKLNDKDVRRIKRSGILRRGSEIYYIKNIEILSEVEELQNRTKEDILCKMEEYRKYNNIELKNHVNPLEIPVKYSKLLRNYQKEGVEWLNFMQSFGFSGILADDMGLGKTIQTLVYLSSVKENDTKFLIIAPKSVLYNWEIELKKFLKTTNFLIYDGNKKKRVELSKKLLSKKFIITSYGIMKKDLEDLKTYKFHTIILDEAQHIKNDNTMVWKGVKEIPSKFRLALSGTPVENSIKNLWSIFEFLMPGYLGDFEKYSGETCVEQLQFKTRPFILRRTKEQVLKELPEKIERVYKIELHERQREIYDELLAKKRKQVIERIKEHGIKRSFFTIFSAITYLREICDHPELIGHMDTTSGKVEVFEALLDDIVRGDHKVIVFSQFVKMLKVLEKIAIAKQIPYTMLTGETKNRKDIIDKFNNNTDIKIFFISLKAGGEGLNLTAADTVIHVDPWWNPMVEKQATDRAYRMGQTKNLNVYKLITSDTIEEKILEIQERKSKLFKSLIDDNSNIFKKLTVKDIENLFT
ncbi:MAG: DEAD/DEAH box helicase [Fusobacteria bacterium]|nr:DEAD/DEAH box helicase [Fusobacteriota bacterium]